MRTLKYVYWQENETWLGYLEEYPDYRAIAPFWVI